MGEFVPLLFPGCHCLQQRQGAGGHDFHQRHGCAGAHDAVNRQHPVGHPVQVHRVFRGHFGEQVGVAGGGVHFDDFRNGPQRRHRLITGGLALLLSYSLPLPFGVIFMAVNLPFFALAVWKKGWNFAFRTGAAISLVSAMASLHPAALGALDINPVYGVLGGNLLAGARVAGAGVTLDGSPLRSGRHPPEPHPRPEPPPRPLPGKVAAGARPEGPRGYPAEAAEAGDLDVVTVPLKNYKDILVEPLAGKIVIDTNKTWPTRRRPSEPCYLREKPGWQLAFRRRQLPARFWLVALRVAVLRSVRRTCQGIHTCILLTIETSIDY